MSFPGEHRKRIEKIAKALAAKLGKEKVLYDKWHEAEFARPNLDTYLQKLYHEQSQLLVFFLCKAYSEKEWCGLEWRVGRDLLKHGEDDRLMFLRVDQADVSGIYSIDGYSDISKKTDSQVVNLILERLDLLDPPKQTEKRYRSFTANLPTVSPLLIGRDDRIDFLDKAWANPDTNVLQIIAPGGTGKTALVDKWFRRYIGRATIFGWSFYSQGTSTKHATSSDPFFAKILSWFGIELPASASVYDRVDAVVERLRNEKVLLILDGIEPLQDHTGTLLDSALKALLQELDTANEGIVLCTTRVRLEIPDDPPRAVSLELENLTPESGGAYLLKLGVEGEEEELQQASEEFGNHALALTLLGTYLVDFMDADIRRRVEIRELMGDQVKYGPHAQRMMEAYQRMFANKPEAKILRALGFFNRPAERAALELVLPPMKDLKYRAALVRLHGARLTLTKDPNEPLDCHPLIREHFATAMRSTASKTFRQGHSQLYEYYCQRAPEQPETLGEMLPLFWAVYHGCQAGRHQEVLDEVYWKRLRRGPTAYLLLTLGAYSADLSLLANFFETPWTQPVTTLLPGMQSWLLGQAAFTLKGLGRLTDALAPISSGLEAVVAQKQWSNAATGYSNLTILLFSLGRVQEAIGAARHSVALADQSGDKFESMSARTAVATALLTAGDLVQAHRLFEEAEHMQSEDYPAFPILNSVRGFYYCDLLLEQEQNTKVINMTAQILMRAEREGKLLDIGLAHLSLGRSLPKGSSESIRHLDEAIRFLRESGSLDYLPFGLLARRTARDLDEVFRIATRSGMRLHLTDYHLTSTRLALTNRDLTKAHNHFVQAETLINETGYHRRDRQLEQLRAELS